MLRTYLFSLGSQMPERSGFPSRARGAGAERFTFPLLGIFVHCAVRVVEARNNAGHITRECFHRACTEASDLRRLYTSVNTRCADKLSYERLAPDKRMADGGLLRMAIRTALHSDYGKWIAAAPEHPRPSAPTTIPAGIFLSGAVDGSLRT